VARAFGTTTHGGEGGCNWPGTVARNGSGGGGGSYARGGLGKGGSDGVDLLAKPLSCCEVGLRRRHRAPRRGGRGNPPPGLKTVVAELAVLAIVSRLGVGPDSIVDALLLCVNRREKWKERLGRAAHEWRAPGAASGYCMLRCRRLRQR
jgi:hypothetical protein